MSELSATNVTNTPVAQGELVAEQLAARVVARVQEGA